MIAVITTLVVTAQIALAMQRWHSEREELELPQESEQELRGQILALRSAGG